MLNSRRAANTADFEETISRAICAAESPFLTYFSVRKATEESNNFFGSSTITYN